LLAGGFGHVDKGIYKTYSDCAKGEDSGIFSSRRLKLAGKHKYVELKE
jgi:hypothetical protein